jgi:hypothetical protein
MRSFDSMPRRMLLSQPTWFENTAMKMSVATMISSIGTHHRGATAICSKAAFGSMKMSTMSDNTPFRSGSLAGAEAEPGVMAESIRLQDAEWEAPELGHLQCHTERCPLACGTPP